MPAHKDARPSLFLLELLIATLFFALGSAVCAQAFARAYTVSRQARELAFASETASSAANAVRYGGAALADFQAWFPGAVEENGTLTVGYDAGFAPCAADAAAYTLRAATRTQGGVCYADVSVAGPDGAEVYALALHWPAEGGAP